MNADMKRFKDCPACGIIIIVGVIANTQHSLCARHCPTKHFSQLINSSQQTHEEGTLVCLTYR